MLQQEQGNSLKNCDDSRVYRATEQIATAEIQKLTCCAGGTLNLCSLQAMAEAMKQRFYHSGFQKLQMLVDLLQ